MDQTRAQTVIQLASQFPNWGNFQKFMTPAEIEQTRATWLAASEKDGSLSFASIVYRIAQDRDPITGEPR